MSNDRELVVLPVGLLKAGKSREAHKDVESLRESIRRHGMLYPILLRDRASAEVVDGERRRLAAIAEGWSHVVCSIGGAMTAAEAATAGYVANTEREGYTLAEKAAILEQLKPVLEAAARERQAASQAKPGQQVGARPIGGGKLPAPKVRVRDQLGKAIGTSGSTAGKLAKIMEAVKENPSRYGGLKELLNRPSGGINKAYAELRRLQRVQEGYQAKGGREVVVTGEAGSRQPAEGSRQPEPYRPLSAVVSTPPAPSAAKDVEGEAVIDRLAVSIEILRDKLHERLIAGNSLPLPMVERLLKGAGGIIELLGGAWTPPDLGEETPEEVL